MGQKINPTGLRIGVIKDWESRWFAKKGEFGDILVEDNKIREFLLELLAPAGVPKVEIERDPKRIRINIFCAKPGIVIGRGGAEIEKLKETVKKMLGGDKDVFINITEIKQPDLNAQLVAENIASQLEKRTSYRRAMKMALRNTMRLGAKGIKISCSGRLAGAEIAKTEHYHEGTIPLQTIRADIEYGFWEADTTYGKIGVKVWIYRGEVLSEVNRTSERAPRDNKDRKNFRRDNRNNGERRGNNRNDRTPREGGRKNVNA